MFAACSKAAEEMTVEEKVMTNAFSGFVAAGTYDSVCGGKKLAETDVKKNPDFAIYFGNRQLFGGRMGTLWKLRHKDGTPEQGIASLVATERSIAEKIAKVLKDQGCESEAGKQGKTMYDLYTKTHPAKLNAMFDKTIEKSGGKVTPPGTVDMRPKKQ